MPKTSTAFRTLVILLFLGSFYPPDWTMQAGTLKGRVVHTETGGPLMGANILITGTVMGTSTNEQGEFTLHSIPAGMYPIQVTMIGFSAYSDTVRIARQATRTLEIRMRPKALESPELVVTGAKRSVRIHESPVSIGTVGRSDIRMRMPTTLNEILPLQPGVQMIGGDVNIRGSSGYTRGAGSRVMVMIDGVPLLAADNGGIYWDAIPSQNIDRIEILKGPGSALYGSNALGGVVNVITTPIEHSSQTLIYTRGGWYPFPTVDSWQWRKQPLLTGTLGVQSERKYNHLGLRIGLEQQSSSGYRQNDWVRRWILNGKLQFKGTNNSRWTSRIYMVNDVHGIFTQWRSAHRPFSAPQASLGDYINNDKMQWTLAYSRVPSPNLAHSWKLVWYRTAFQNHQHDNQDFSTATTVFSEWQSDLRLSESHLTSLGVTGSFQWIQANLWANHTGYDFAAYAQDEWQLRPVTKFTTGIRLDYSRMDNTTGYFEMNPKIGLNHHLTAGWTVRMSAGRAFRTPSVAERFIDTRQNIFEVKPNPDLRPEISTSIELGSRYEGTLLTFDAALFSSYYRDFIDPVQDPTDGKIQFRNITDARISGSESTLQLKIPGIPVTQLLSYTYLFPRDISEDTVLAYRHEYSIVWQTGFALTPEITCSIDYQYRSQIRRVQLFPTNPKTGADERVPIHLWDLNVRYSPTVSITFRLAISNLFRYYYVMYERNMGEPMHVQLEVSYRM